MRVDYETISILLALSFSTFNDLKYFLEDYCPEIISKIDSSQYYPLIISDTVRILDRESLINNKFFDMMINYHSSSFTSPGYENLHSVLNVIRMNWRKGKELPRNRIE